MVILSPESQALLAGPVTLALELATLSLLEAFTAVTTYEYGVTRVEPPVPTFAAETPVGLVMGLVKSNACSSHESCLKRINF